MKRRNIAQLLVLYGCVLFYIVFLTPNRHTGGTYRPNFIPVYRTITMIHKPEGDHFWSYYTGYWGNLFGNIILFMPFGFLLKWLSPDRTNRMIFLYGVLLSMSIEILQLWLQIGVCDVDDVLLNAAGTAAGIMVYKRYLHKITMSA